MICIDSDVFLIDLRYPADARAAATRAFLAGAARRGNGVTTIFNLLEICGVLSFNLGEQPLIELFAHFPRRYRVRVLPAHGLDRHLPALRLRAVLAVMQRKAALGDALIAALVNELRNELDGFVTWNEAHFRGRLAVPVWTPATVPAA